MNTLKCDACNMSFNGIVCFRHHVASEKHKDNMLQMHDVSFELPKPVNPPNPMDEIHCSTCKVSISGWVNYQTHVNSLEHAIMVQKKHEDFLSPSLSRTFGLGTERNQLWESTISLTCPTKAVALSAEFKTCRKQFSGPENCHQHLESTGHRKKFGLSTQILQNDETDSIVIKDNMNDILPNNPQSSVSTSEVRETLPKLFLKCDICEIEFSSALPYINHIVSTGHKMKASDRRQSEFKCDVCVMKFTGPAQYQLHLVSEGHKKNTTSEFFKQIPEAVSLPLPDSTTTDSYISHEEASVQDIRKWYCDICKKQCSGSVPYNNHIISQEHSENLKIMLSEETFRKIKESGLLEYFGNDEIDSDFSN